MWVDFIFLKAYDWLTFKDSRWEAGEPTSFQGQWEASISMKLTHVYAFDHEEKWNSKKSSKYQRWTRLNQKNREYKRKIKPAGEVDVGEWWFKNVSVFWKTEIRFYIYVAIKILTVLAEID